MTIARRSMVLFCLLLLVCCMSSRLCLSQPSQPQPSAAQPNQAAPNQPGPASSSSSQAYKLPPDKLAKAIALNRIRDILDIVYGVWGIAFIWILLASKSAAGLEGWVHGLSGRRWLQGLIFFAVLLILITLGSLPLDIYAHHLSRAYGISIQGWPSWLGDQGKSVGLTLLFGAPVLLLFNWIVRRWPRRYWFGIWLVTLPLMVISIFVAPLLEPLFNKYEPLTKNHAALVDKLETVVARTGTKIPPDRMFLMNASVKTNGLNAYVNGVGATKRIVVWDTTAGRVPDDEIMFIFGHESGHYVLNHIPKMLCITAIGAFFIFWACSSLAAWLARRFGASWRLQPPHEPAVASLAPIAEGGMHDPVRKSTAANPLSTRAGFTVLILAIVIASFVLEPINNTLSRHFEHQADVYGQEAIHTLVPDPQKTAVAAFDALGNAYLEDPAPNPFIEFWEYSHPSVNNRANFAAQYDPWANGGHGQFFDK